MSKTPNQVANELADIVHPYGSAGIDRLYELVFKIKNKCFEESIRLMKEGKTPEEIREFAEGIT